MLVEGKIEDPVTQILVLPPVPPEPGAARSVPGLERDYFISNAARIRYRPFAPKAYRWAVASPKPPVRALSARGPNARACTGHLRDWMPVLAVRTAVLNDAYDAFYAQQSLLVA